MGRKKANRIQLEFNDDEQRNEQSLPIVPTGVSSSDREDRPIFIEQRSCRDVFCTVLFILALCGMVALAFFAAYRDSDPRRLISGYDKFGNTCGRNNPKIEGAKYSGMDTSEFLYHYSESGFDLCVKKCPAKSLDTIEILKELFDEDIRMCKYDIDKSDYAFDGGVLCAEKNSDATHHFILDCVSDIISDSVVNDQIEVAKKFVEKFYTDCYTMRKIILSMIGMSIPLSFLWLLVLRYFSGIFVYSVICLGILGFSGSTTFMWLAYYGKIYIREAAETHRTLWLFGSIAASFITSLACCMTVSMMKRIQIAIAILEETTKFISSLPMIMFQPFYSVIFSLISLVLFSTLTFSLMVPNVAKVQEDGITVKYENDKLYYLWLLPFFFLLWICQITNDSTEYVIAGSMAKWYFTRDRKQLKFPIIETIKELMTYHFGSIAFGSLLIAILKFVRSIMYYIAKRMEAVQLNFIQGCLSCVQCFLSCFEKSIKFLTRNAYIEMAISGNGFIKSAKDSFKFMVDHALSLVALNAITFLLLWFSRIVIVLIIVFSSFYLQRRYHEENDYNYSFTVATVAGITSLYIAHTFMQVYDMSIDSLFYCFCKDKDHHKSTGKAYYMSKDLMKLVHAKKKTRKRQEEEK